ncbi:MAG: hypothetical protein ACHQUB_02615 [Candidatus Saccharimonadia bacterium]
MLRRLLLVAAILGLLAQVTYADTLKSSHFEVDESFIGGGGLINENSSNFSAAESIGDAGIGLSNSTSYISNSGYTTDNDPALSFYVSSTPVTFTTLSPLTAATATSTFSVVNYTSWGYVVQIIGNTPSYVGHSIPAMGTLGPSQVGTEQYGINLVANISPISFGSNPDNGTPVFGYGQAATGYNTANNYKYASGDTIANAPKSSGKTNYTISYIMNVTNVTPGGVYTTQQQLICTGTY